MSHKYLCGACGAELNGPNYRCSCTGKTAKEPNDALAVERQTNEHLRKVIDDANARFKDLEQRGLKLLEEYERSRTRAEKAERERDELKAALELGQQNCDAEYNRLRVEREEAFNERDTLRSALEQARGCMDIHAARKIIRAALSATTGSEG